MRTAISIVLGAALWALAAPVYAAPPGLAARPAPTIELYTMGLGSELVEKFGHSALCVRDADPRRDRCYNYGTTDFEDPLGLGWGFLRGRSRFWVSTSSFERMLENYEYRDRTVWRQVLPLSPEQARAAAARLRHEALPANRYYHYHHFYDNCSTRVRDIIDEATGGVLSSGADGEYGPSFRELSRQGFAESPVMLITSDLVLGRGGDKRPSEYQAMFLPDALRDAVREKLGVEPELVYERQGPEFSRREGLGRFYVFLLAVLLAAPIWYGFVRRRESKRLAMVPAVLVLSLLGLVLWTVSMVSPLAELRFNECLLLFFPGDVALLVLRPRWRVRYARVRVAFALLATALASMGLLVQPLWAVAPLLVLPLLPVALSRIEDGAKPSASSEAREPEGAVGAMDVL